MEEKLCMNKDEILIELMNIRSFLMTRGEVFDSMLLEYLTKSDIYDIKNKDEIERLLRNAVGFHKSFTIMKSALSRLFGALGDEGEYEIGDISTTLFVPKKENLKLKKAAWDELKRYYKSEYKGVGTT